MSAQFPEYFALFGIAPRFAIDPEQLTRAYREVLSQVHPDRFAGAGPAERRAAMQLASHANEAFEVLRSDVRRASYLCGRQGLVVDGPGAVPLPPEFLERQMQWHEDLDAARAARDASRIDRLRGEVARQRAGRLEQVAQAIDEKSDYPAAAAAVRALMFLDKLGGDIDRAATLCSDALGTEK